MQVMQILKDKGELPVITVTPETNLADVANLLSSKRIGAVVVTSDGRDVVGILSERDIVREVARRGSACLTMLAGDVMTREIKCCAPTDSTDAVMERMTEGRFRHMPVRDKGEMIGVISIGDVVKARLAELHMEKEALTGMIMGN
ncbi:MAG: CBS domain-containing protein [Rhodobacteraceae bacterium]|nr:CBS domain-containing protein [Paracoccaceae bacterium]